MANFAAALYTLRGLSFLLSHIWCFRTLPCGNPVKNGAKMPETLNRANTIWPRASVGPLHPNPASDADDQRNPTCATQPLRSSSEIHPKRQKHRLVKKPASQQESLLSSRDESRPIADVPVPPSLRTTEIAGVVSENRPHAGELLQGNKIYNQHMVPTARALN